MFTNILLFLWDECSRDMKIVFAGAVVHLLFVQHNKSNGEEAGVGNLPGIFLLSTLVKKLAIGYDTNCYPHKFQWYSLYSYVGVSV